ncbi:MAG: hypothetical protein JKY37_23075, partial [Nannocystaceae bacterium]|nr:hypothetical protein [Nannocystaceae bacterium]
AAGTPGDAPKARDEPDATDKADGGDAPKTGGKPSGLAGAVRDAIPAGGARPSISTGLPARGKALGWVIASSMESSLAKAKTQLFPEKYAMYGDLGTLRAMGTILGEKSSLVQHFNFAEPAGCVLLDETVTQAPFACFFSYEGGAAAVSTDVADGKQDDAGGHVAHHVISGQELFVDDLGGAVVVTGHTEMFAKSKGYLSETLLPYAKTQADDLAMVVFPAPLIARYETEAASMLAAAGPQGGASLDLYRDVETFVYAFALKPDGAHLSMNIGAKEGTDYANVLAALSAGPVDEKWFTKLPSTTWAMAAYSGHFSKLREGSALDAIAPIYEKAIESYARETGKDAATVRASLSSFFDESLALYGAAGSWGMLHEPGTTGAMVLALAKDKPGREKWKTWSEAFTSKAVLDKDALKNVDWSFKADAVTVDGVVADRWTIQLKKVGDPTIAKLRERFGGKLELTIDRLEFDDSVVFVAALSDIDKADAAVVAASKGTNTLADAPGGKALMTKSSRSVGTIAGDGKRMFAWLSEVAPEGGPYPSAGVDLTDFVAITQADDQHYNIDMAISQPLIDQLKTLVP